MLARGGAKLLQKGFARSMTPARAGLRGMVDRGVTSGMQAIGRTGLRAGTGLGQSGQAFAAAPIRSLGRGALEMGKGMMMPSWGKGLGGTIGTGMFAASLAGGAKDMAGGGPGAPQLGMPQPYGGSMMRYPQQPGGQ